MKSRRSAPPLFFGSMIPDDTKPNQCLNCQADLGGDFCSQCGQAKSARLLPAREWASEFFATFLKLDSKLLRTTQQILFQPGQATVSFGKGHRVAFSSPARVYIIVSAISIAVMSLQGVFSQPVVVPGLDAADGFQRRVQLLFPFVNLLSPFVTAGILAICQPRFYFQLHLAFSLHLWTFLVAIGTPLVFIPPTSIWSLVALAVLSLITTVYLFLAHRRVYVMQTPNRIIVCGIVLASVPIASFVFIAILFAAAAWTS